MRFFFYVWPSGFKEKPDKMVLALGMIFLQAGLAEFLNLSALLAGMTMGCVAVNLLPRQSEKLFRLVSTVDTPVYVLFFVLAGANLQLDLLTKVGLVGVAYIVSRIIGKVGGATFGAIISKAPAVVRKYLGLGPDSPSRGGHRPDLTGPTGLSRNCGDGHNRHLRFGRGV